ncbi:hypothetical protein [Mesorhizobium sp.]|uniref:hypothetical protein n=1 Tax=Mesorhizobium sp. TaxID=1871066 RepID=UPI0026C8D074
MRVNRLQQVAIQIAFLGPLFTVLGFITDDCYALAAGTAGNCPQRIHPPESSFQTSSSPLARSAA